MSLKLLTAKHYEHAFECHDCPQTNGEHGCPMWLEYEDVRKDGDGLILEKREIGGCAPVVLYKISSESSNRTVLALAKSEDARAAAEKVGAIFDESRRAIQAALLARHVGVTINAESKHSTKGLRP